MSRGIILPVLIGVVVLGLTGFSQDVFADQTGLLSVTNRCDITQETYYGKPVSVCELRYNPDIDEKRDSGEKTYFTYRYNQLDASCYRSFFSCWY